MLTGLALHGTTTGTSLTLDFSLLELGTYYFRLVAVDKVGNVSTGVIFTFAITTQFCDIQR